MLTPQQAAAKWAQRLGAATDAVKQGVQAVQVSPMEKAANRQDAYISGVTRAANSGKWARGLRRRTLGDWQQSMINKGLPRIASGAAASQPKMESFMQQWLPYEEQLKNKLASMPRGTLEQNKARMNAAVDWNAAFVRQG